MIHAIRPECNEKFTCTRTIQCLMLSFAQFRLFFQQPSMLRTKLDFLALL